MKNKSNAVGVLNKVTVLLNSLSEERQGSFTFQHHGQLLLSHLTKLSHKTILKTSTTSLNEKWC